MIGVKNREGILGTDIFCKLGLLIAAAARPGAMGLMTVNGLITAPLGLSRLGVTKEDLCGSYEPGPGESGFGSRSIAVD